MHEENEISLKELLVVLLNQRKLIGLITIAVTSLAIIFSLLMPNVYEAQSQVVFSIPESDGSRFGTYLFPSQNVADFIPLLDSLEVKSEVASKLELKNTSDINSSFVFNENYKYVTIKTQANTPEKAKELNDVFVSTYINRINAQYKLIAIDKFIYNHEMNISNLNYQKESTQSMIDEKSAFLEILDPVYTLQKAVFSDPRSAALYADKFNLDLGSLSNDVVLEEFVNQKYLAIDAEIIDLKTSMINMNESLKYSELLLKELKEEKAQFSKSLESLNYEDDLFDELTVLKGAISQVSEAVTPDSRISPRRTLNVAIGFVLGLMFGVFIAFFKHYWTTSE